MGESLLVLYFINFYSTSYIYRYEYLRTPATELADGGRELLEKQSGFHLINPTEKWFPGLNAIKDTFSSWDWRYGKTPKFSVIKSVQIKSGSGDLDMKVKLDVEKVSHRL